MGNYNDSKLITGFNHSILFELYKIMLLIRRFEEKIIELYPEQEMRCPVHLCIGHEAIHAGVCLNLNKDDVVFSNHRCHGHYLAKGGDAGKMLAEIYGKAEGCSQGRGGSMHLIDLNANFFGSTPIVGGTVPLAAGSALVSKMRHEKRVTVAFFGDAAAEEGVLHETLNFASLHKLPVLFVCENNFYSTQTHISQRQPSREISKIADGHNVLSFTGDGNNVMDVYKITKKAKDHINAGNGPVFLEFLTYRFREHCGPNEDSGLGYRSKKEIIEWMGKDPIKRFETELRANSFSVERLRNIEDEIKKLVEGAVSYAKAGKSPERSSLSDYHYSD